MSATTVSSRIFNQDIGRAKRAAESGPVIITDRGRPAYVLLRHDAWRRLVGERRNILDTLAMPGLDDPALDPPPLQGPLAEPVDLS
jgi:prevent-host-death family protein